LVSHGLVHNGRTNRQRLVLEDPDTRVHVDFSKPVLTYARALGAGRVQVLREREP
jgi:hypothetical protein